MRRTLSLRDSVVAQVSDNLKELQSSRLTQHVAQSKTGSARTS